MVDLPECVYYLGWYCKFLVKIVLMGYARSLIWQSTGEHDSQYLKLSLHNII